ncbi:DUF5034 domain-containing protein [Phaeocystidibacter luteus]|uniref:DUF5034 domain-containing protein n=1 Tax=Phaeocystidibacter luteus TaxID=911197 RepID=A0A6N6RLZ3_9FLAO|nr:DUF5034 domain-containing protein [Phaeocystidibacter luteus]KAB2814590.1 DUF5034 domain-containing protein [Phaeocystidibacter luteus]
MRLKTALLAIFLLSLADLVLYGCYCDCDFAPTGTFEICSIDLLSIDNAGGSPATASDTVLADAYAIEITLNITQEDICSHSFLMNSAFAASCNCPDAFFENRNPVTEVHIYTVNDFSTTYDAGDEVTSLFYRYLGHEYEPINSFLRPQNAASVTPIKVRALLMEAPAIKGNHSFEVELIMQDSTVVSATTSSIYLK